jgi:hypothetical protein
MGRGARTRGTDMKRVIVNFSDDFDYQDFKSYAEYEKISLSRAILELAQNALEDWKDERLGDIALERLNSKTPKYLPSDDFWNKADDLQNNLR